MGGCGSVWGALSFNGSNARVTVPDSASLDLTSAMTLEAWVFPTVGGGLWRDVIYKGPDDIYYLRAPRTEQSGGGQHLRRSALWDVDAAAECVVAFGGDVRWVDVAVVCEWGRGGEPASVRADPDLEWGVDDRR